MPKDAILSTPSTLPRKLSGQWFDQVRQGNNMLLSNLRGWFNEICLLKKSYYYYYHFVGELHWTLEIRRELKIFFWTEKSSQLYWLPYYSPFQYLAQIHYLPSLSFVCSSPNFFIPPYPHVSLRFLRLSISTNNRSSMTIKTIPPFHCLGLPSWRSVSHLCALWSSPRLKIHTILHLELSSSWHPSSFLPFRDSLRLTIYIFFMFLDL